MLQQLTLNHEHFFQYRDLRTYTWCRDFLGQRSLIDFCIVSAELFQSVLNAHVEEVQKFR